MLEIVLYVCVLCEQFGLPHGFELASSITLLMMHVRHEWTRTSDPTVNCDSITDCNNQPLLLVVILLFSSNIMGNRSRGGSGTHFTSPVL